jgi:hypothetical protein
MSLDQICSEVRNFIAAPDSKPHAFDELARKVFAFQFARNSPYRAFCESRGVTPDSLTLPDQIPAIVTSAFKDLELSVLPSEQRTAIFYSSGTTEQRRSRHIHSSQTLEVYEESLLRWFEPHLCPDPALLNFLILTPRSASAPNSSLVHMFETVARTFGKSATFVANVSTDGSWDLDYDKILTFAHSSRNIPGIICGTAFSFVHLCDRLTEEGTRLHFPLGSRIFETGGYKGRSRTVAKSELHALISERLQIHQSHIVTEYGMSEISSQAYDRVFGRASARIFNFPHWVRASVISLETGEPATEGETGLLRILDLANVGSVCAVQTEDLAIRRGSGFELIGRATEAESRGCSLMQMES